MSFVHAIYSNSNIETKPDIDDSLLRFIFKKHHRYYNGKLENVLENTAFKNYGNTSYVAPFVYIADGDLFKYNELINEIISIYIGFFFGYFHSKTLHALVSVRVNRQKELIQAYRGVKTTIQSLEQVAKDMEQES
jgi:superoxide dismutase